MAPWHPSSYAHELRSGKPFDLFLIIFVDQLAYFWLSVLKDSLMELKDRFIENKTVYPDVVHIFSVKPLVPSNMSSLVTCYTNYEPKVSTLSTITSLILMDNPDKSTFIVFRLIVS